MITFTADGKDYVLEVTAATLKQMNKMGVNFARLSENLIASEILWKGLFLAHHSNVPEAKRMALYNALSSTPDGEEEFLDDDNEVVDELMSAVLDEYETAVKSLKRSQGNLSWKRT